MTKYLAGAVVEQVHLSPRVYKHFAGIAARNDCSVVDLLSEALRRIAMQHPDLRQTAPVEAKPSKTWPITVRRWSADLDDVLRASVAADKADTEIAREIGCSTQMVFNHRTQLGLPANRSFPGRTARS